MPHSIPTENGQKSLDTDITPRTALFLRPSFLPNNKNLQLA